MNFLKKFHVCYKSIRFIFVIDLDRCDNNNASTLQSQQYHNHSNNDLIKGDFIFVEKYIKELILRKRLLKIIQI